VGKPDSGGSGPLWPGIIYCIVVAAFSFITWISYKPVSGLMWAFIYSIIIVNVAGFPKRFLPGINFCSNEFLKVIVVEVLECGS